jgi:CTP synthase (UTP-ammonia lyase)
MNQRLQIGIVEDYDPQRLSHLATVQSVEHAAQALTVYVDVSWVATPMLTSADSETLLRQYDALWCAPGSPYVSTEGALSAIRYAREQDVPFLGT